ncbi:MAG: hypothetical protein CYPHOPRED_002494 [Cyphobasidiales sp. Tagirdzhanova-0007]|nr:MAG: hypothetical protein CYPHOPRED_002494 [Cyphobasidiales sp. Tagirdzhanova-0007]
MDGLAQQEIMALEGKRALITASSAGLGKAIAIKLASQGATCAINYASNTARAEATLHELSGKGHKLIQGSMFTQAEATAVVKTAIDELAGLDFVVSNAGWTKFGDFSNLESLSDADWDQCYAANVKSHLWVMQTAREQLDRNKASAAGIRPSGSSMAYAVSKAAAIHLAKSMAKACAPNITVNSVSPGVLATDWSKGFTEEQLSRNISANALGRLAELEDCAETVLTLLKGRSITGQNIEISAGFQM